MELQPLNLLPSGSNSSSVEGMDTSFSHTHAFVEQEEDTERGHHDESYESDGHTALAFEKANQYTFMVTQAHERGFPVSPVQAARMYSTTIGRIVRQSVKITCTNLRMEEHSNMREELLSKLFNQYLFSSEVGEDAMKRVKQGALLMMAKALVSWRNLAKKNICHDFETCIKRRWPQIQEEDWQQFIDSV